MIARLRDFASGPAPDVHDAAALLRLVYVVAFAAQLLLALAIAALLGALVPNRGVPNDVMALVLLGMAVFHLPLGWVLGRAAIRAGGRQAALSGVLAAGILFSIPAWFGALLLISGQRPGFLLAIMATVSVGYALGFVLTGFAARIAAAAEPDHHSPTPTPPAVSAAPPEEPRA